MTVGASLRLTIVVATCAVGLLAGAAKAGGTQVNVVATAGRVWVTTGHDLVELDSVSGRVLRRVNTRYPYPIEIGVSDGVLWASSVENGFISGAITRVPFEPGRATQPLVLPHRPILSLAVGSGTTWALVGPWSSLRLAAVDQLTQRATLTPIRHDIGWLATDNTGLTPGLFGVTTTGQLVRIASDGSTHPITATPHFGNPPVIDLGSVWVADRTALYRISIRSGKIQGRIPAAATAAAVTTGGGYVWMVSFEETPTRETHELLKIDPRRMRIVGHIELTGSIGGIAYGNNALWIGRALPTVSVLRVDPTTLTKRLFASNLD